MLRKPIECRGFGLSNPGVLFIIIGMGIMRVEVARPALFLLIGNGRFVMGTQIVSKSDVTFGMWRIHLEKVKLNEANTGLIGKSTIAPSRYAKLAVPIIAKRLNAPMFPVEFSQSGYQRHELDDRFGGQTRYRGRTDVMDDHKDWTKYPKAFRVIGGHLRPIGIIRG